MDAESDCRFYMFFEKWDKWGPSWAVPGVCERKARSCESAKDVSECFFWAYWQEATGRIKVKMDMPGKRNEGDSINGTEHYKLYFFKSSEARGRINRYLIM